jgi:hypothetical protein
MSFRSHESELPLTSSMASWSIHWAQVDWSYLWHGILMKPSQFSLSLNHGCNIGNLLINLSL